VIRLIYNLLWPIALLFFLPGYLVKMLRRGGYRKKFGQRLGLYSVDVRKRLTKTRSTWLHAVSVGEVAIALKLSHALRDFDPDLHVALTTTTTTGFAFAQKSAPDWIEVMYSPLDFWPIMRRALAIIRPMRIVLVEAEVWPNLVALAHARKIPILLVNARLSPRSENRFRRFRVFVAPTFRLLDLVCVQEPDDADRWSAISVSRNRIQVVGSIKYDPEDISVDSSSAEKVLRDLGIDHVRPVVFGGSTHRGEEEILGRIFVELREKFPDLFLIIAPRHTERAGEIRRALEQLGLRVGLRSRVQNADRPIDSLVLDSTGELRNWYGTATVVFMGKSLGAHGGQNPVEPISAGKPIVFGPHMENFSALADALLAHHGAIQISSETELKSAIADLLHDPVLRQNIVANAAYAVDTHRGATVRTARLINQFRARAKVEEGGLRRS
jgi:3-deoxy-D-manno-octulosonic-acid transferase